MFGKNNNGNNTGNNTGNDANHTSKWRWLALLLLVYVFLCLVVIHVANYVYLRNAAANGVGLGYTGYSAAAPIFENGIAEFVSLGFLILPLVLMIIIFSGWWDYRTAIVANVFAIIDVIVILFVAAGVITVHHMNNNSAYGGVDYCNYVPQHTVFTTAVQNVSTPIYSTGSNNIIGYTYTVQNVSTPVLDVNNNIIGYNFTVQNVSTPIFDTNRTIIGYSFTLQNVTQNHTVADKSGSAYIAAHHYCKGQTTLLAGICALLFGMFLTWFLTHLALNGAKRHANTTVVQTTQTAYAMQPIVANTVQYPAAYTTTGAHQGAYATNSGIPVVRSTATGNLNNV